MDLQDIRKEPLIYQEMQWRLMFPCQHGYIVVTDDV